MIKLKVVFDFRFVDLFCRGNWSGLSLEWESLLRLVGATPIPLSEVINPGPARRHAAIIRKMQLTRIFIQKHQLASIKKIQTVFPDVPTEMKHAVHILFMPCGTLSCALQDGIQLFALDPLADPLEANLFLTHVYYHEISSLNYSDAASHYSKSQDTAEELKSWIRLLIRNEGIANFAILKDVSSTLMAKRYYRFRYFYYARQLKNHKALRLCVDFLRLMFNRVADRDVAYMKVKINSLLKSKDLSVINILGTHMACCIVRQHGLSALRNVYRKEPEDFFMLYDQCGDTLSKTVCSL